MPGDGFESLVIQNLGDLQEKVGKLAEQVGGLNLTVVALSEAQKRENLKREQLTGPLTDWTLTDSVNLKRIVDRERLRIERNEESAATQTSRDRTINRWRDRVVLVGAIAGLFAGVGLRFGDLFHTLGRLVGVVH